MGQTLENGIYLPSEGERNCYNGLASNWTILDAVVGGYNAHIENTNIHITSAERSKWNTGVTQAYVLRYASVSLTALGTVAFSALDNTDNIKIGDKVLDSEGKLFALTAVDTANSTATLSALLIDLSKDSDLSNYYTKGETDTLLSSKANDSGVMHLTGDESASGNKNFKGLLSTLPDSTLWPVVSNTTADITGLGDSVIHLEYKTSGKLTDLSGGAWNVIELGIGCLFFRFNNGTDIRYKHFPTNNVNRISVVSNENRQINSLTPETDNTYDLGDSTRRWKTINSINPGALSFPDLSSGLDISAYITDLTGASNINKYTPNVNGWIGVGLSNADFIELYIPSSLIGGSFTKSSINSYAQAFMPVIANKEVRIALKGSSLGWAKFYPCQGNV